MPQFADHSAVPEEADSHESVIDWVVALWPDLCQVIPDRFQSAANRSIAESHERQPYTLDSYRGFEFFSEALHQIGRELCERRGCEPERINGQVRFLHPPLGVRFLIAHATLIQEHRFRMTSQKGQISKHLVAQNRARLGYDLVLYSTEELQRIKATAVNLWWIADVHGEKSISTYLAYPNDLSERGDLLCCEECRHIGDRDLSEGDVASLDLPPSPSPEKPADFDVRTK